MTYKRYFIDDHLFEENCFIKFFNKQFYNHDLLIEFLKFNPVKIDIYIYNLNFTFGIQINFNKEKVFSFSILHNKYEYLRHAGDGLIVIEMHSLINDIVTSSVLIFNKNSLKINFKVVQTHQLDIWR